MEEITDTTGLARYIKQYHFCNRFMDKAKSEFYRNMISNNSHNPCQLWNCINRTLLFLCLLTIKLIHSVSKHFNDKITQIHSSFPGCDSSCNISFPVLHHPYTVFKPVSLTEVAKLILSSPNKDVLIKIQKKKLSG